MTPENKAEFKTALNIFWPKWHTGSLPSSNDLLSWWDVLSPHNIRVVLEAFNRACQKHDPDKPIRAIHVAKYADAIAKCHAFKEPNYDPVYTSLPAPDPVEQVETESQPMKNLKAALFDLKQNQELAGIRGYLAGGQVIKLVEHHLEHGGFETQIAEEYRPKGRGR